MNEIIFFKFSFKFRNLEKFGKIMDQESPIVVNKKQNSFSQFIQNSDELVIDPILDTRYQSFSRFYIRDILDSDTSHFDETVQNSKGLIKINDLLLYKVAIAGLIVGIYDSQKYFRLKIDDSTGCINATLWKSSLYNEYSSNLCSSSTSNFKELYDALNSIQARIKEKTINNSLMYEPKQGDLVLIRGHVKCFKERIDLNVITCSRIQNSNEELLNMMLPAILNQKIYSIPAPTNEEFELARKLNSKTQNNLNIKDHSIESGLVSFSENENFLNLVYNKLTQLASAANNKPCSSYSVYNAIRNKCLTEFKSITLKHVLDSLKVLEIRGIVYSCEDDFHYLPIG